MAGYKYNLFTEGQNNEQLFDLINDPGEMTNLIGHQQYAGEINRHRELLRAWIRQTNDNFP